MDASKKFILSRCSVGRKWCFPHWNRSWIYEKNSCLTLSCCIGGKWYLHGVSKTLYFCCSWSLSTVTDHRAVWLTTEQCAWPLSSVTDHWVALLTTMQRDWPCRLCSGHVVQTFGYCLWWSPSGRWSFGWCCPALPLGSSHCPLLDQFASFPRKTSSSTHRELKTETTDILNTIFTSWQQHQQQPQLLNMNSLHAPSTTTSTKAKQLLRN